MTLHPNIVFDLTVDEGSFVEYAANKLTEKIHDLPLGLVYSPIVTWIKMNFNDLKIRIHVEQWVDNKNEALLFVSEVSKMLEESEYNTSLISVYTGE